MSWTHPKWGEFERDDIDWKTMISIPSFARFSRDTDFPDASESTGKHKLVFTCEDEDQKPSVEQVKLAEAVVANQEALVKTIATALWNDFNGEGPESGMYWHGDLEELAKGLDSPEEAPQSAEDVLKLLQVCAICVHTKRGNRPAMAEIAFHASFEQEHGVSVLTDGKKILGIGYMYDVEPFGE